MNAISHAFHKPALAQQTRRLLARTGRVHLPGFLEDEAAKLMFGALQQVEWRLVVNTDAGAYDFAAADLEALGPTRQRDLLAAVHSRASKQFQFMFDSFRISDLSEAGDLKGGMLFDLFNELNSEGVLATLREVTGEPDIAYLDAQATRYRPGHFLTVHDDHVEEKHRLFAYVINLTPYWIADWGGLLMFVDEDGHVAEAYTPRWNALNILRVPQPHAVSVVAPFAPRDRFSITGWMRSKRG